MSFYSDSCILLSIIFISKFGKRPMHLFGMLGSLSIGIGLASLVYLSIEKLVFDIGGIAQRPLFFFGILTLIIGTQLFLTGFLAELVSHHFDEFTQALDRVPPWNLDMAILFLKLL